MYQIKEILSQIHTKIVIFGEFSANFLFSRKNKKICADTAQILENFEILTHWNTNFYTEKGPIDIPESLIYLPKFAACPQTLFCTKYPPGYAYTIALMKCAYFLGRPYGLP